jgi:2-oxopent-4-enoate hydratase
MTPVWSHSPEALPTGIARPVRPAQTAGVQAAEMHRTLADELWEADRSAKPVSPLTERHPGLVLEDAYEIQRININRRVAAGQLVIGRKVGLTSRPMQEMLGVDEPDFGVLTDEMFVEDGDLIPLDKLVQPRVEAELAFVMDRDLSGPGVTTARALGAIAGALPAVEVVDSRVADWKIKLVDTVADNASSGMLVVGGRMRKVEDLDLRLLGVVVSRHGQLIDTGAGAAALGNPARCVAWLANKLGSFGDGLQAGDIVLPGAVHKMVPVAPGDVFRADFAHLGAVTVRFSSGREGQR